MKHVALATSQSDADLSHVRAYGPFNSEREAKHFAMDELWANRGMVWSVCELIEESAAPSPRPIETDAEPDISSDKNDGKPDNVR